MDRYPETPLISPKRIRRILNRFKIRGDFHHALIVDERYGDLPIALYGSAQFLLMTQDSGTKHHVELGFFNTINWYLENHTPIQPIMNLEQGLPAYFSPRRSSEIGKALLTINAEDRKTLVQRFEDLQKDLQQRIQAPPGSKNPEIMTDRLRQQATRRVYSIYMNPQLPGSPPANSILQNFASYCLESRGFAAHLAKIDMHTSEIRLKKVVPEQDREE